MAASAKTPTLPIKIPKATIPKINPSLIGCSPLLNNWKMYTNANPSKINEVMPKAIICSVIMNPTTIKEINAARYF
ncbi:hypothetical protein J4456_05225 [Candidatus Pacearchaeota archaeon]|nr:hypothetical protein [Candidatus Pacearchaeota archaeon]